MSSEPTTALKSVGLAELNAPASGSVSQLPEIDDVKFSRFVAQYNNRLLRIAEGLAPPDHIIKGCHSSSWNAGDILSLGLERLAKAARRGRRFGSKKDLSYATQILVNVSKSLYRQMKRREDLWEQQVLGSTELEGRENEDQYQ